MFKTFHDDDDLKVCVQNHEGAPFLHCEMKRWSPSVYKKMVQVQERLKQEAHTVGVKVIFAYNTDEDQRWRKFMETVQFKKLSEFDGHSVYFWELNRGT